jgi:DNA-binding transcriptional MerR regulator
LGVDEVAELIGFSASTVRAMARKGLLHPLKSKGMSGSLRFRKSRLVADMARMENL